MKTLLVNGCSWTAGGGLDTPDTKEHMEHLFNHVVWPSHVKRKLGFDKCINLAEGCGSNQRICRTTFDWVMQQDAETLKNTTVIIQWSHEDRYEYYVPTEEEKSDFQKRYQVTPATEKSLHVKLIDANTGKLPEFKEYPRSGGNYSITRNLDRWARVNPNSLMSNVEDQSSSLVRKDAESRYRTYTDQEGMYNWVFHMGFLYNLLKSKGVEVYFWYFTQYVRAMPEEIQDYIYDSFPMLEDTRWHGWTYERIGDEFQNSDYKDGSAFDPHPNHRGHEQLADHIIDAIAKKKTILRRP
jgi:hypothetical protein